MKNFESNFKYVLGCLFALILFQSQLSAQSFFKVSPTGLGDGSDWDNALGVSDLESTLEAGGTVYIAAGTYMPGAEINLFSSTTVVGGFPANSTGTDLSQYNPIANPTIIDGQNSHIIFKNNNVVSNMEIKGLILENGNGIGAAIQSGQGGSMLFNYKYIDLTIRNNSNGIHGALVITNKTNINGTVLVQNCHFSQNSAGRGAAIHISGMYNSNDYQEPNYGNLVIEDCTFTDNTATATGGGAISMHNSHQWAVRRSSFCNNSATGQNGGALRYYQCYNQNVIDCSFDGNSANLDGGAIYAYGTEIIVENSEIVGNSAGPGDEGGGIFGNTNAGIEISNVNFYNNSAGSGGGIWWPSTFNNLPIANTIDNCIFDGNLAVENSTHYNNGGGAIKIGNGDWSIQNSFFVNNEVTAGSFGGAINLYNAEVDLDNNLFYNNLKGGFAIPGCDLNAYNQNSKFTPMANNMVQLPAASFYTIQSGTTLPDNYDFTNDTFSNTDDGSTPPAPVIECPTSIFFMPVCSGGLAEYAITDGSAQTTNYFWDNASTPPADVMLTQQYGTVRATELCEDGNWRYYSNINEPNHYLFAIDMKTNTTEIEYIELRVEQVPTDRYAISNPTATYVMQRDWHVETVGGAALTAPVDFRFYFPPSEYQLMLDDAIAAASADPGATVPTTNDVVWFKKEIFDPIADINPDATGITGGTNYLPMTPITIPTAAGLADTDNSTFGNGKNYVEFSNVANFSGGTAFVNIVGAALPVALSSFAAESSHCNAILSWTAESETNFSHYLIERSADGFDFEYVQEISPLQFDGTKAYSYTDEEINGKMFYRLKMLNLDGSYSFTDVVRVETNCENLISNLKLFPNPIGVEETNINIDFYNNSEAVVWITITNFAGTELLKFPVDANIGENTLGVDISNLTAGTYFVSLRKTKGKAISEKFVRLKE